MTRTELRYCRSASEIEEALWADDRPSREGWLVGVNYDQNILPGQGHLSLEEMDRIGRGRPVYLFHLSRHEGLANSKALELAGVGADTPDPPEGLIHRDGSGRPSGRLMEMAVSLVEKILPAPGDAGLDRAIRGRPGPSGPARYSGRHRCHLRQMVRHGPGMGRLRPHSGARGGGQGDPHAGRGGLPSPGLDGPGTGWICPNPLPAWAWAP